MIKDPTPSQHPEKYVMSHLDTMLDIFLFRMENTPEERGYLYLPEQEEAEEEQITYGALGTRVRTLAAGLQAIGNPGERVLLMLPSGLDYVVALYACFLSGLVAVPAFPPGRKRSRDRLTSIAADSGAKLALATTGIHERFLQQKEHTPILQKMHWLYVDGIEANPADWVRPAVGKDQLALLQYTSGSTTTPKGVMLSHGNLMHNVECIRQAFHLGDQTFGVFWLPMFHDMGLVGGILTPLYIGCPAAYLSPTTFLRNPYRWLAALSRFQGTISGAPCSAFELCVQKVTAQQREQLDLSHWELAFCGAEPIYPEILEQFATTFQSCGFRRQAWYPCYGLAESTLFASGNDGPGIVAAPAFQRDALEARRVQLACENNGKTRSLVGCGQAPSGQQLLIVDPHKHTPCDPTHVGEIWLRGESIAQGYWNRSDETHQVFQAHLASTGEGPFMRTGDLGFVHEGQLFVTGRLKDLIVIRGTNHYPEDIEHTILNSHPAIRQGCAAAFPLEVRNLECLGVMVEVDRERYEDPQDVISAIREGVTAYHEISVAAVVLVRGNRLPRTTSGKIQRHKCKEAFVHHNVPEVTRWEAPVLRPTAETQASPSGCRNGFHLPSSRRTRESCSVPARCVGGHSLCLGEDETQVFREAPTGQNTPAETDHLAAVERAPQSQTTPTPGDRPDLNPPVKLAAVKQFLRSQLAEILHISPDDIDVDGSLAAVGVDSVSALELMISVENRLHIQLQPQLLMEHPTIHQFAEYLLANASQEQLAHIIPQQPTTSSPTGPNGSTDSLPATADRSVDAVLDEHYKIELFPELIHFRQQIESLDALGLNNPYYRSVDRVTQAISSIEAKEYVGFSGYDYLGLTHHPEVTQAAKEAIDAFGTSVSASRLVWGERPLHAALEHGLAEWLGTEGCVVFNTGYLTNVTTIGHLLGPSDLIVYDSLSHNSLFAGCALSGARRIAFPHNDWKALDAILQNQRSQHRRALIILEGVYSMDGDFPDLPRILEIKQRYRALLMIDEAHSIGVLGPTGRGIMEHFGIDPKEIDIQMGTLSKTFASCGGFIAGSASLVHYLRYTAPGLVYSVGMSPANTAAALQSLQVLQREPQRVQRLGKLADLFLRLAKERGFNTGSAGGTAVVPIILGDSLRCIEVSQALFARGIIVHPIVSPAVEENAARLRFFINATHTTQQIHYVVEALGEELAKHPTLLHDSKP